MKAKPGPKRDRERGGGQKEGDASVTRPRGSPGLTAKPLGSEAGLPHPGRGEEPALNCHLGREDQLCLAWGWGAPGAQEGPRLSICHHAARVASSRTRARADPGSGCRTEPQGLRERGDSRLPQASSGPRGPEGSRGEGSGRLSRLQRKGFCFRVGVCTSGKRTHRNTDDTPHSRRLSSKGDQPVARSDLCADTRGPSQAAR